MLVSCGSLPVMVAPLVEIPFPQSGCQGSVLCWGPYLVTEKPQRRVRVLGVQPIRGTVIIVLAPTCRSFWTNTSDDEPLGNAPGLLLGLGMFSKYQSEAWLFVSFM